MTLFSMPAIDEQDALVLIHKEAHFGGSFSVMLDYYNNGKGRGIHSDISIEQIERLQKLEVSSNYPLIQLLNPHDQQIIQESIDTYAQLKQLYNINSESILPAQKVADLILSEEELPQSIIDEIKDLGESAVETLIGILDSPNFYHSAFPGYGLAPELAVRALKEIKSPKSIEALFSKIGKGNFFFEDVILETLTSIGQEAKEFLWKKLQGRLICEESEKAAVALIHFPSDPELIEFAIEKIQDPSYHSHPLLLGHLALIATETTDPSQIKRLKSLSEDSSIPSLVRTDLKQWLNCKK